MSVLVLNVKRNESGNQGQITPSQSVKNKVLATVDGKSIYSNDVHSEAVKQYGSAAGNNNVVQNVLDQTKKRVIMDSEAAKQNITVSTDEIKAAAQYQFPQDFNSIPDTFKDGIKYTLLQDKLTAKNVESRTAYVIGFWVPPISTKEGFSDDQNATFDQQRQEGVTVLNEVLARLQHGEAPFAIADAINKNHPVMKSIMGVNGYIVDSTSNKFLLNNPRVYIYQKQSNTKSLFDTLFNSNEGDIKRVESEDGSGGFIIQVLTVNHSQYKTFDDWLQSKSADLAK